MKASFNDRSRIAENAVAKECYQIFCFAALYCYRYISPLRNHVSRNDMVEKEAVKISVGDCTPI